MDLNGADVLADGPLSARDVESFQRDGYLVLEGFLAPDHCRRLIAAVDRFVAERGLCVAHRELGLLTSHPPALAKLASLLGPGFVMHHVYANCFTPGDPGRRWHHDYRQIPQTNRSHAMIHALYYLSGLNGEIGDLLLLPGSHRSVAERDALDLFATAELPGSIAVDRLAPGSAVFLHSALFHARRPKPGGEGALRYFADVSYCQRGVLWPGYEAAGTSWHEVNRRALELGLDRDGRHAHLYDSAAFFSHDAAEEALLAVNRGSLVLRLAAGG